jgi:hypothetical protein
MKQSVDSGIGCAAAYREERRMIKKLGPGGLADNVTRSFLTDSHGKTGPKMEFYCLKFFFPRFSVCTTMLQVKRGKDK